MGTYSRPQAERPLRHKVYVSAVLTGFACVASYGLFDTRSKSLAARVGDGRAAALDAGSVPLVSGSSRPQPQAGTRRTELQAGLGQLLGELGSELHTIFADRPQRRQYEDCSNGGGRCDALLHEGTAYAIGQLVRARLSNGRSELARWVQHSGGSAVAIALGQIIAGSTSEFERIAALLLLASDPAVPAGDRMQALPAAAYRELARRNPTEVMMLAARERGRSSLPPESAREFVPVVASELSSVRRLALAALGYREHAAALRDALELGSLERQDLFAAAMAISNCGLACQDSLELLLQTGTKEARVALYEAITFAPDEERKPLVASLRAATAGIQGEERELRDELLREALGDEDAR